MSSCATFARSSTEAFSPRSSSSTSVPLAMSPFILVVSSIFELFSGSTQEKAFANSISPARTRNKLGVVQVTRTLTNIVTDYQHEFAPRGLFHLVQLRIHRRFVLVRYLLIASKLRVSPLLQKHDFGILHNFIHEQHKTCKANR